MSATITIPRGFAEQVRNALYRAKEFTLHQALHFVLVTALKEPDAIAIAQAVDAALAEPDVKRKPATAAEIVRAAGECALVDDEYLLDFRDGFRAAERHHGIRAREQQPGAAGMSGAEADRVLTDAIGRQPCRYPACQDADGRCPRIFAGECSGPGGVVA